MPDDPRDLEATDDPRDAAMGDMRAYSDLPATVRVPEFLTVARGVQPVGFLERHRVVSLLTAGLTTLAMVIGGLLIFL